eukprot:scaffold128_cov198-Alexandrium_tamarense.AAC.23
MADLHNILDELNDNQDYDDIVIDGNEQDSSSSDNGQDEADADVGSRRPPSIPSALAAAADQRYGAGAEEKDYQSDGRHGGDDGGDDGDGEGRIPDQEYEQLKSLWYQELASPELLYADAEIVSLHVDVLEGQEETIDDLLLRSKHQHNPRQQKDGGASGELASLVAQITKMDLDRTRFMLVDLARTRMAKIENHALHNRTLVDRMTAEELEYLKQYGALQEKHFNRTVLDHLPREWNQLDNPEMIDSPNLEEFVFCRVLETVQIDVSGDGSDGSGGGFMSQEDEDGFGETVQEHQAGACLIVMYKTIREFVLEGKIELLM